MASSADPGDEQAEAARTLGALLTGTEARLVAAGLDAEESVTSAFAVVDPRRRVEALALVAAAGLRSQRDVLAVVLRGIEGAHSVTRRVETLWTMPGHLAGAGSLTTSLVPLVAGARESVVCSTFNFQRSSGMWTALHDAAARPGVSVRVYVDAAASEGGPGPSAVEVATWLAPGRVLRSRDYDGKVARNHAKFLAIDHRFVVVTSANFSWSAEYGNVELGLRIDDPNLADRIEREMQEIEEELYELVAPGGYPTRLTSG